LKFDVERFSLRKLSEMEVRTCMIARTQTGLGGGG